MENSGNLFVGDDTPQWYIAMGEKWIGPLSAADVYERIQSNQISVAHYAWRKGQSEWKRICDLKAFQVAVPRQPAKTVKKEVKETSSRKIAAPSKEASRRRETPPASQSSGRVWYLHYNDSQFGPFSEEEVQRYLQTGKLHGRVYAWREGMPGWERLGRIEVFKRSIPGPSVPPQEESKSSEADSAKDSVDQRSHPRMPLVAKIWMANEQSVIVGVCRDISIGGLQVLTEKIPGSVGTRVKMNISPSGDAFGKPIEPFVAEGVIVRILEDRRGFSFRFEKLPEKSRQAIESYIESSK